jgi:hypothetical protein
LLRRARLRALLLALGERRLGRPQDAKAPQKRAHGHEWPGDEARKTGAEQRSPEKDAARRCGDGVLVRLQWGGALLDERAFGKAPKNWDKNVTLISSISGFDPLPRTDQS